jgi:hypothetical protein
MNDDLGHPVDVPRPARRVVSLVPSLTEAIAATRPEALVGATDWCTHPDDLAVARVRGTKNPDRKAIEAIAPDLVIANREENRELDIRRLRDAGIPVWVTVIETVDQATASMRRMFVDALGWDVPSWLAEAEDVWAEPAARDGRRVAIPIWRDPWMVVGSRTFTVSSTRSATRRTVTRTSSWARSTPTWCCCRTSPTCSPPTTAPRPSPRRPAWCRAAH